MVEATAIDIRNVSFAYPDGVSALEDVSLHVERNERVAILGANGAGKSTLLYHLNGIFLSNGCVRILGATVSKRNLKSIRQKVGMIFQNPDDQLFCPTVYDDVAFGPRNLSLPQDEVERRVSEALGAVDMAGFENRSAFHLSFGQKKRVAIATVLAMDSEILALDEPTSNLDPKGRRELVNLLKRLGRTQIVVTHDLNLAAEMCQRAVVLHKGRKKADGPTAEVLGDAALLRGCDLL
ncbi:MAG: energy-coupling factor ABC transporter ATP-binding protein [Alphaproteobacteria bacterium]